MEPTRKSLDNYLASLPKRAGEHNAKLIQAFCRLPQITFIKVWRGKLESIFWF